MAETPKFGVEPELQNQQQEVTPQEAQEINAALSNFVASLRENAPTNAQRASRPVSTEDKQGIDDLASGMSDEILS